VHEAYVVQTHEGLNRVAYVYCKNAAHWHALAAKALAEKPEQAGGQAYFISNGDDGVVTVKELRDGIFRHRTRPYKYNTYMTNWVRRLGGRAAGRAPPREGACSLTDCGRASSPRCCRARCDRCAR